MCRQVKENLAEEIQAGRQRVANLFLGHYVLQGSVIREDGERHERQCGFERLEAIEYRQILQVINGVLALRFGEDFGPVGEGNERESPVGPGVGLEERGADGVLGGVGGEVEGLGKIRKSEGGNLGERGADAEKSCLAFLRVKLTPFCSGCLGLDRLQGRR